MGKIKSDVLKLSKAEQYKIFEAIESELFGEEEQSLTDEQMEFINERLAITNGEVKKIDLLPYLDYPIYTDLKNESYCSKATVQNGTVIWSEKIDIDPDILYLESK